LKKARKRKQEAEVEKFKKVAMEETSDLSLCVFWIICVRRGLPRPPLSFKKPTEEKGV